MTPTQRSLTYLRDLGFTCAVVERWNPHMRVRQDLFGFADLLAIKPGVILLVQVTSGSNTAARRTKILTECRENAAKWLDAGGEIEIHGWRTLATYRQDGTRAKRDKYHIKLDAITEADLLT